MTFFWHRRDLRIADNAGLYHALKRGGDVQPVFIFDRNILDRLPARDDARVTFIHGAVTALDAAYRTHGARLLVRYGDPVAIWRELRDTFGPTAVYTNRDYEPYALTRDAAVRELLAENAIPLHDFKDHVILESGEVEKKAGGPYTVFTPYMRSWRAVLDGRLVDHDGDRLSFYLKPYPTERYLTRLRRATEVGTLPTLRDMGFRASELDIPAPTAPPEVVEHYGERRDFPAVEGTTHWGVHLRHGTVSVRAKARLAQLRNDTLFSELIWRDFYSNILQAYPHVVGHSYRPAYDTIPWENDEGQFARWCAGTTGVPLVDAGMRQLNASGFMHNRVRMVVASYLTKHLLIDWRWGEAYFAEKLLDYELASNNGGWQWAAGSGVDAQPYFRIFNFDSQQRKFDPNYRYVRRWVPEYGTEDYPQEPVVAHTFGRDRALKVYKTALTAARGTR